MKKTLKLGLITYALLLVGVAAFTIPRTRAASNATLTLTPSSGSHDKGTSFTVTITENSGTDEMNAIQTDLTYDAAKLQYVGSTANSNFVNINNSGGSGKVSIIGYVNPVNLGGAGTYTGIKTVGTVTFKALVGTGTTAVSFANTSHIVSKDGQSDLWDNNATGGTYTLTTPSTGGGGGGGGGGSTPAPTPTNTSTPTNTNTTTYVQPTDPTLPVPASNINSSNNTYLVAIKVVDAKGHVVSGATVTLGSQSAKTDETGYAGYSGIAAGTYQVTVKGSNIKGSATITVDSSLPTTSVQQFEVKAKALYNWPLYIGIAAGVIVIVIIFAIIKGRGGMKPNFSHGSIVQGPPPTIVTTSGGSTTSTPSTPIAPTAAATAPADSNMVKPNVVSPTPASGGTVITPTTKA